MAPTKVREPGRNAAARPRVLVVDDETDLLDVMTDTLGRELNCRLVTAGSVAQARQVLESQQIDLMVTDVHLPDGDGRTLLSMLRLHQPTAEAIVMTGRPDLDGAIEAFREGAGDFLPKPFDADMLFQRVRRALNRSAQAARAERRMERLRTAVKRLNDARKTVSKKVDILCNDLISAYGELSRQLDLVRVQEGFNRSLREARDLEQLLCHTMDWMLRQFGYSNIAVWLAGDEDEFQLGAYMKYTIPGESRLTDALRQGLVKLAARDGLVHLSGEQLAQRLSPVEQQFLAEQDVLAINCTYLAESLGVVILFRDAKSAFTDEDVATLKAVCPLFATALAGMVRGEAPEEAEEGPQEGPLLDDSNSDAPRDDKRKKKPGDAADWWKRGEEPPF